MQIFVQSSVVEKGMDKEDYPLARADAFIGVLFANLIAAFIVISTAATLHQQGIKLENAADAAQALAPAVGQYAKYLFAVGLFGASMLAMGVLPIATAYSLSEALGFEKGLSHTFREAPIFLGIFTSLIISRRNRRADSGNSADQTFDLNAIHQRFIAPDHSCRHRFAFEQR